MLQKGIIQELNTIRKSIRLPGIARILLLALTTLFGLQILRVMISQMVWVLGDYLGLNAIILGLIALVIFSSAFLTGPLKKFFNMQGLIIYTVAGTGLIRFLLQIPWPSSLVTLIISILGVVLFGLFLGIYTDEMRFRGNRATANMITGFLAGIIIDTAIHGAFGTYDVVWQTGVLQFVLMFILVALQWILLYAMGISKHTATETRGSSWPWLAIGPFFFLQSVVLQNVARQTVTTGWDQPYAFGWVLLSDIAGLFASVRILKKGIRNPLPVSLLCGVILLAGTSFPFPENSWLAAGLVFIEQVSASILLVLALTATVSGTEETAKSSVTLANGTGFLLMGLLIFAYYAGYQIKIPFENTIIEPVAAVILLVCAVIPGLKRIAVSPEIKFSWSPPLLSLVLLILPLIGILTFHHPQAVTGNGYPVKIMTYNLHNGFSPQGDMDLEALAEVIEAEDPDIVALQEISRGWLVSGRVDMLTWLSQRLDMPYATGPTEGPLWGNAVLSRYPVTETTTYKLPPRDLFLRRGILVTRIDLDNNKTLTLMATHLHHIEEDSAIRQIQIPVLLNTWNDASYTVLTGDMNAEPDSPEMIMLRKAGLIDVMADSVPPESYTYSSIDPYERIDYIWLSPDLNAVSAGKIPAQASDHMPVVAEISR